MSRNLAALVRGVEEGHHGLLDDLVDGAVRVVSDVEPDLAYRVEVRRGRAGDAAIVSCSPVDRRTGLPVRATHGRISAAPGDLCCKHAAVAVRRLVREGLLDLVGDRVFLTPYAGEISAALLSPVRGDLFDV